MGDDLTQNWAAYDDDDRSDVDIWADHHPEDVPSTSAVISSSTKKRAAPTTSVTSNLRRAKKQRKHKRGARGEQVALDLNTPAKVLDFLWTLYTNAHTNLTELEQQDTKPTESSFLPTHDQTETATTLVKRCVTNCESTLKKIFSKSPVSKSPLIIFVTGSSNRACAIIKELSSLKVPTAKLFSRHMKIDKQHEFLQKTSYPIGVGTPNRLLKLLDLGYLTLQRTTLIVFDVSNDIKGYCCLTQMDTRSDTAVLLQRHLLCNESLQFVCMTA